MKINPGHGTLARPGKQRADLIGFLGLKSAGLSTLILGVTCLK